ncbi:MliC family protein [Leptospira brenneri]|uniref:Lysozyme inhibitor n=1 Tax=Leptospira brenneri TaxID=2023182 RepID=A0A2M9Y5G2_9LEPT|nr:MliC family protein [Leptospira brenneri]PJZ46797.1 lysozyme inhibitor [Leptospira brenneri]TGK96247.1 lysozyme inhibitor [Leptospira brenneri]
MKTSYQSKFFSKIAIIAAIFLPTFFCTPAYEEIKAVYQGHNGQKVTAMYHNPLDGENTFSVTLKIPYEQLITLNQAEAASGVRYTDDKTLVWWTKGVEAFMMKPDGKGDWEITGMFKEIIKQENR